MEHISLTAGLTGAGTSTVTVAGLEAVWPLSSATLQVTVMGPADTPPVDRVAVEPSPLTVPDVEL